MNLQELTIKAHMTAERKGMWKNRTFSNEHLLMKVVCKVSRMMESSRENMDDGLAGVAIELMYMADYFKVNFGRMIPCHYYRAFERFGIYDNAAALCKGLLKDNISIEKRIQFGITYVENWAAQLGIDIDRKINNNI